MRPWPNVEVPHPNNCYVRTTRYSSLKHATLVHTRGTIHTDLATDRRDPCGVENTFHVSRGRDGVERVSSLFLDHTLRTTEPRESAQRFREEACVAAVRALHRLHAL